MDPIESVYVCVGGRGRKGDGVPGLLETCRGGRWR